MIVVQRITVQWTRASRGMPGAGIRNNLPTAMRLPTGDGDYGGFLVHEVVFSEAQSFAPQEKLLRHDDLKHYWKLTFAEEDGKVPVRFDYCWHRHGAPKRRGHRLFALAPGQTGWMAINGRHAYYDGVSYSCNYVSVGNVEKISPDLFLATNPVRRVDKRDQLF